MQQAVTSPFISHRNERWASPVILQDATNGSRKNADLQV